MLVHRNDNNLYNVKRVYPNNMLTTISTIANNSISASPICLVTIFSSNKHTQTSPVVNDDLFNSNVLPINSNNINTDDNELAVILPDMGDDLSSDLLLIGPFSSPVQIVTLNDDTTSFSIMTSPIFSAENENIPLNADDNILTNVDHLTSRIPTLANNHESQLGFSDLLNDVSHLSIYNEDDLSISQCKSSRRLRTSADHRQ